MKKLYIISALSILLLTSAIAVQQYLKGVDTASMNKKQKPQEDFFEYANGSWLKNNPIPTSEARWGAFNIVAERNNELLRKILESSLKAETNSSGAMKYIYTFYSTAMDTNKINEQRFEALYPYLTEIQAINSNKDLILYIAKLHKMGVSAAFDFEVSQDVKNSQAYIPYLSQGGLGLPDKDYYLKTDERSVTIRKKYEGLINLMFSQISAEMQAKGLDIPLNSSIGGQSVLRLETSLAEACMSRTERRNMKKQYHPTPIEALTRTYLNTDWGIYFGEIKAKFKDMPILIVMQPDYFKVLDAQMNKDLDSWKNYLSWKLINTALPYLHDEAVAASFSFYGTTLTGTTEQKPRWKRVINQANSLIGELVAQEYVKVAFTPESKLKVNEMVTNLSDAFKDRIQQLDWMSEPTKIKALQKLQSFTRKLGYPDSWTDFSEMHLTMEYHVMNYFNASNFWFNKNLSRLGKRVDKTEWEMLPQTVNAYYNPVNNEIVFPAAIMQPPFFDPEADDAVNYGAIGAVIGHEFSHGFDDQGSKYDDAGNLNDWWTEEDRKLFDARTQKLVEQYNNFEVLEGVKVNGELTLGENIADLAGLTVAYDAYQRSLKGKPMVKIDGFTPEQRFFIGFGQVWKSHARPEFLRQQVVTDPHSPAKFRVLGPLSNMPEFYQAFKVKKGNNMWREENNRVKIW